MSRSYPSLFFTLQFICLISPSTLHRRCFDFSYRISVSVLPDSPTLKKKRIICFSQSKYGIMQIFFHNTDFLRKRNTDIFSLYSSTCLLHFWTSGCISFRTRYAQLTKVASCVTVYLRQRHSMQCQCSAVQVLWDRRTRADGTTISSNFQFRIKAKCIDLHGN